MIESDQRKATFLRTVCRTLDLDADVLAERIETAPPQAADIVSARALAPLPRLLPLVRRHLAPGGTAILPKGASYRQELEESDLTGFDHEILPSRTSPDGVVLCLHAVSREG